MTATPPAALSLERMRLDAVLEGLARGDTAALARAISLVENQRDGFERVLSEIHKRIGKSGTQRIGITGPPGAGKSTRTEQLVLVLVPESGDGIQTLKAGVMEVAELYVINKSDRPGADKLKQEVEVMLGIRRGNAFAHITPHHQPRAGRSGKGQQRAETADVWEPPVLTTVASKGEGIPELVDALNRHHSFLETSGKLAERRKRRLATRTRAVVNRAIRQWVWDETQAEDLLAKRLDDVAAGTRTPYEVAAEVLDQVRNGE